MSNVTKESLHLQSGISPASIDWRSKADETILFLRFYLTVPFFAFISIGKYQCIMK